MYISDIAYNKSCDNTVYLLENEKYVPFLVLTDDYCGYTLLLRRDIMESPRRFNEYSSFYENSEIDDYLNNEYLKGLTGILPFVQNVDLKVTDECAIGNSGDDTKEIERKVFLLSYTEIGVDSRVNVGAEGVRLPFFEESENRIAYCNNVAGSWWLRTPNTYFTSCVYVVGDNNKIGFTNAYDKNGIRPAFCVKGDMPIELSSDMIEDQSVYVFLLEDEIMEE